MISLNWNQIEGEIGALVQRYAELPRHIAKKHMVASMRRALKPGVPILRSNTPPLNTRRGRRKKGEKPRSSGALRRAVTTRVSYKGRNADGVVFGVLGYKAGAESRKAIWQEFGTSKGILPRAMVANTMERFGPRVGTRLAEEMKEGLERAARELASKKNPGVGKSGFGPGR